MKILFTIVMSFALACSLYSCDALAQESEVVPNTSEPYFISAQAEEDALIALCAATLLLTDEIEAATWFTTIVSDVLAINYFTNVFTVGIDTGQIKQEELDEASAACLVVKAKFEARQ